MLVRHARIEDADRLLMLAEAHARETRPDRVFNALKCLRSILGLIEDETKAYLVLASDDELAGYCIAHTADFLCFEGSFAEIGLIYVDPGHRGAHAAADLARVAVTWARNKGCSEVNFVPNDRAGGLPKLDAFDAFARRAGFEKMGASYRKDLCHAGVAEKAVA